MLTLLLVMILSAAWLTNRYLHGSEKRRKMGDSLYKAFWNSSNKLRQSLQDTGVLNDTSVNCWSNGKWYSLIRRWSWKKTDFILFYAYSFLFISGTRIVYERSFMMSLRHSPISQTPPKCALPAALLKNPPTSPSQVLPVAKPRSNSISFDESQETFSMDL